MSSTTQQIDQQQLLANLEKRVSNLERNLAAANVKDIQVPKKNLGKNGPLVSILGLGLMGMSAWYTQSGGYNEEENLRTIKRALDAGINFFDTADVYGTGGMGFGSNEELLGKAIKLYGRDKFFVATKFMLAADYSVNGHGKREYVRAACEASLKRLGIDTIDLYYQHRPDPETPIEETMSALAELVKEGKIRHIGLSEVNSETLRRACKIHQVTALQSEYSAWSTDVEKIIPTLKELGIALVPYSPLGRGFLTGTIQSRNELGKDDFRANAQPRFQEGNFEKNIALVKEIEKIAQQKNATTAQIALAWVLAQGDDLFPIPGTKHVHKLEDLLGSLKIQLSNEEKEKIRKIMSSAVGQRYTDMRLIQHDL